MVKKLLVYFILVVSKLYLGIWIF